MDFGISTMVPTSRCAGSPKACEGFEVWALGMRWVAWVKRGKDLWGPVLVSYSLGKGLHLCLLYPNGTNLNSKDPKPCTLNPNLKPYTQILNPNPEPSVPPVKWGRRPPALPASELAGDDEEEEAGGVCGGASSCVALQK
jgi:hypothetical protein